MASVPADPPDDPATRKANLLSELDERIAGLQVGIDASDNPQYVEVHRLTPADRLAVQKERRAVQRALQYIREGVAEAECDHAALDGLEERLDAVDAREEALQRRCMELIGAEIASPAPDTPPTAAAVPTTAALAGPGPLPARMPDRQPSVPGPAPTSAPQPPSTPATSQPVPTPHSPQPAGFPSTAALPPGRPTELQNTIAKLQLQLNSMQDSDDDIGPDDLPTSELCPPTPSPAPAPPPAPTGSWRREPNPAPGPATPPPPDLPRPGPHPSGPLAAPPAPDPAPHHPPPAPPAPAVGETRPSPGAPAPAPASTPAPAPAALPAEPPSTLAGGARHGDVAPDPPPPPPPPPPPASSDRPPFACPPRPSPPGTPAMAPWPVPPNLRRGSNPALAEAQARSSSDSIAPEPGPLPVSQLPDCPAVLPGPAGLGLPAIPELPPSVAARSPALPVGQVTEALPEAPAPPAGPLTAGLPTPAPSLLPPGPLPPPPPALPYYPGPYGAFPGPYPHPHYGAVLPPHLQPQWPGVGPYGMPMLVPGMLPPWAAPAPMPTAGPGHAGADWPAIPSAPGQAVAVAVASAPDPTATATAALGPQDTGPRAAETASPASPRPQRGTLAQAAAAPSPSQAVQAADMSRTRRPKGAAVPRPAGRRGDTAAVTPEQLLTGSCGSGSSGRSHGAGQATHDIRSLQRLSRAAKQALDFGVGEHLSLEVAVADPLPLGPASPPAGPPAGVPLLRDRELELRRREEALQQREAQFDTLLRLWEQSAQGDFLRVLQRLRGPGIPAEELPLEAPVSATGPIHSSGTEFGRPVRRGGLQRYRPAQRSSEDAEGRRRAILQTAYQALEEMADPAEALGKAQRTPMDPYLVPVRRPSMWVPFLGRSRLIQWRRPRPKGSPRVFGSLRQLMAHRQAARRQRAAGPRRDFSPGSRAWEMLRSLDESLTVWDGGNGVVPWYEGCELRSAPPGGDF